MPYVLVLSAACLWGLLGPVSRVAMAEGITPLELAFWRAALASVLFGAHAAALRQVRVSGRDLPVVAGFGLVGVALFFGAYFRAVETGGAALAAVLLYTAPVWVAVLSVLFLAERVTGRKAAAVALAVGGVAGIAAVGGAGPVRISAEALGWGLLAGVTYALYYLFGKRYFTRYAPATVFLYAMPVGALAMLPLVDFRPKSAVAWGVIVFLAVLPTYAAYLLYGLGLRRLEATRAATIATIEPVVAAVGAYLMWGERLGAAGYLFAAVVLAGVVLMVTARSEAAPGLSSP
jgi:drug/metabolite transporter, DME family